MRRTLALASVLVTLAAAPGAYATDVSRDEATSVVPPSATVTFTGFACLDQGASGFDRTRTRLTLAYDGLTAATGHRVPTADRTANCSAIAQIRHPAGWSYRIVTARYLHDTSLQAGGARKLYTSYHFQGQSDTTRLDTTLTGPVEAVGWRAVHRLEGSAWSPCGAQRALVFNPRVALEEGTPAAAQQRGTIRSAELELEWRRCD